MNLLEIHSQKADNGVASRHGFGCGDFGLGDVSASLGLYVEAPDPIRTGDAILAGNLPYRLATGALMVEAAYAFSFRVEYGHGVEPAVAILLLGSQYSNRHA